jgi:muramoyltetrapeptide carboxypeptidase
MICPTPPELARPRALKPGGTLGVVAPASPFDRKSFYAGVQVLESMGFCIVIPEEIYDKDGYLAGSDQNRAAQLNRLFADPEVDGIICARGGYGAMRILPLLDVGVVSSNPKVFVGFSDITALLFFLVEKCLMVSFHGPTVATLGKGDPATRERFYSVLTDPSPLALSTDTNNVITPGRATGRFFCANLTILCHLIGTPFLPDLHGQVLLIEDRGEAPYRIDRMLTHMLLAGCFDGLAGLALGTFANCGSSDMIHRIVADRVGEMGFPVQAGFNVGHGDVNLTLPVGLPAKLDTDTGTLTFINAAVLPI